MANYQDMSMLSVAEDILKNHNGKMKINDLMQQTLEAKGLDDLENENKIQLYLDITTSSLFVYMGDEEWDLKERQSLEMFDKDGSEFNVVEEDEDDEDILKFDDEDEEKDEEYEDNYDEDDENYDDDEDEDDEDLEHDENGDILERYHEDDDFDEDKYNDYMDDFENMYDDN